MNINEKSTLYKSLIVFVAAATCAVVVYAVSEIKAMRYIGAGVSATNVISVSGNGDVSVAPDIAEVGFTIRTEKKTVAEAQAEVKAKLQKSVEALTALGVAEKDIKTTSYNSYPQYDYVNPCDGLKACYVSSKPILRGYEVSEAVSIKVRATDKVGDVLDALGKAEVTELTGPNFTIDDIEKVKSNARELAIKEAQEKAETLARQLGVRLVRITSFSENAGGYQPPVAYMMKADSMAIGGATSNSSDGIMQGQNKITSQVTITYEIR